jgi:hypothetical protein
MAIVKQKKNHHFSSHYQQWASSGTPMKDEAKTEGTMVIVSKYRPVGIVSMVA